MNSRGRPRRRPPTYTQCLKTAEYVLWSLKAVGEPSCCIVGGLGIKLYGIKRTMKDVDIIVLKPNRNQMAVKQALCDLDPERFSLKDPRQKNATFKRLMYHVPKSLRLIEIDLLFADEPEVEIPRGLTIQQAAILSNLPVAPLHFILYHKLLGWADRVDAVKRPDKRAKARTKDRSDILQVCRLLESEDVRPLSKRHFGQLYLRRFRERARAFVERYGDEAGLAFRSIGFSV
ncbi:hypothetical protein CPB86DRAFT_753070 [Serendipita vermifera]|nr:hypothetical protein CPB86DRAFT_753070 [Serendipita vermifera]